MIVMTAVYHAGIIWPIPWYLNLRINKIKNGKINRTIEIDGVINNINIDFGYHIVRNVQRKLLQFSDMLV